LSFAQFEREIIGERIRDKIASSTPSEGRSARVVRQPI
jgi:DNA invertase Pin-like site-specific DNA recombinase